MRKPSEILSFFCVCLIFVASSTFAGAFVVPLAVNPRISATGDSDSCAQKTATFPTSLCMFGSDDNESETDNKFDMAQRIESLKSVVLGALSGGVALTPIAYLHYVVFSTVPSTAQWEFQTDMSSIEAALFAIVYRYAVRANDNNPMLNQGVVGAFVVVRTLANIQVTDTCQSVPLRCE